jgi:hypothetical protein
VLPPDATAETVEIVKKAYGFDKPLPVQFAIWLGKVVTGDFGESLATRRPVFLEVDSAHRIAGEEGDRHGEHGQHAGIGERARVSAHRPLRQRRRLSG